MEKLNNALFVGYIVLFNLWVSSTYAYVSYDRNAIIINGQRRILLSGSIHYPRSTPEMWPDLINKGKEIGLDVIDTYVFWNGHEPEPGKYYFEDRYDLVRFIKLVQEAGLYVNLRLGPYLCAEWNFGGFPVWLKYVPGISFRTDNEPFKTEMQRFTTKIVDMMKADKLYENQGGPIILSQIENEYGPIEYEIGEPGQAYAKWAAQLALDFGTGVTWTMCKQDDAPDPIIDTCNDFYCDYFYPNKPNKPKMWTEAWSGWFTSFGSPLPYRPAEDMAFAVAKFIQKEGVYLNYYMFHGGTNFGRTAGGPYIATSYDYDAPLDEYGLKRQPKWGHLKDLHKAIKLCEPALVSGRPTVLTLGKHQEAYVYESKPGSCAAFISNNDEQWSASVLFRGTYYELPPWSISILPDCKNTVYNTAKVGAQTAQMTMTRALPPSAFKWNSYEEETASYEEEEDRSFSAVGLLDQLNTTWDKTDYLWYSTDVTIDPSEGFLNGGKWPVLNVLSAGDALHVFVNGQLSPGSVYGIWGNPKLNFSQGVNLRAGVNKISLLSVSVGLQNMWPHFESWRVGVHGPISISGLNEGERDLTWQTWSYKIGMKGEHLSVTWLSGSSSSSVEWVQGSYITERKPLTWYKTTFNMPDGKEPLALDMNTMSKGQVWINGQSIGRYWTQYKASGDCGPCNYAGWFDEKKCISQCGEAPQRWYHVPRSWLKPTGNLLVVFEEWGGNPHGITLVKRQVASVCAYIDEWQPSFVNWQMQASGKVEKPLRPKAHLSCDDGQTISSIRFASFGTPQGVCGNFHEGTCHAFHSYDIFDKYCTGRQSCTVPITPEIFGGDPCPSVLKSLAVEAVCS